MSIIVMPPAWPLPRSAEAERVDFRLGWLRAEYPRAGCWYAERCGTWMAAPAGATRLIEAPTAVALAARLAEHYRRRPEHPKSSAVPRPARRIAPTRAGEPGMSARRGPAAHRDGASTSVRRGPGGRGEVARPTRAPVPGTASPGGPPPVSPPGPAAGARRVRHGRAGLGTFWRGVRRRLGFAVGAAA
ncbi:hypothetical protein [Thermomonospora cellulosilytica]|uniref:Uncharacterized protein n=1 Tax=Thermomonospora cellulosilytica TaxID=1411118 RepID=A0A7W3R6S8_9ACTN|nr:hypothetical protein [Thermomonospora cellulosilytica]MBA9002518.1 hypothetical protein [Thermomonospora cellulosilytica]